MYANNKVQILEVDLQKFIKSEKNIEELRGHIKAGGVTVVKNFATKDEISTLREYLISVRMGTFPEFVPIEQGAKNNYRINFDDPRAQVRAFFHVWSFYTWNQDIFNLYNRYASVYALRNLIAGLPADTFCKGQVEMGCAARLSVQYYPAGKGYFFAHEDPYDKHQLVVPIMAMSKKGDDFNTGGNFVRTGKDIRLDTEQHVDIGDLVLFNSQCEHGVDVIDPNRPFDPLSNEGRWMMLFAVNKVAGNNKISDAIRR